jgi:hypothetical protein
MNYLLIEAMTRFYNFYGDTLKVEFPTGSNNWITLDQASYELMNRMVSLFVPDKSTGCRSSCTGRPLPNDPHWKDLILFNEYFHGDTGKGLGASHQTGWSALVASCLIDIGIFEIYVINTLRKYEKKEN